MKALALFLAFAAAAHVFGAGNVAAQANAAQTSRVAGIVLDAARAPVRDAQVILDEEATVPRRALTGEDGRFVFENVRAAKVKLIVAAEGFARRESSWSLTSGDANEIEVVLAPAALSERVTVTATRTQTRLGETAASVVVLSRETLRTTAAVALDDALRQVPGFQLFRRTGSRAANPTTQGVSLRGVGASGAGRALVLADGVPLGDPFGGWVYWGRVPRESVRGVEVLRGGASDLYGSAALGGVVQVLTRKIEEQPSLSLEASYASQRTLDASLFTSARKDDWGASLAAESFHTGGYHLISREERGDVDTPAASRYSSLGFTLEHEVNAGTRLFARGNYFGEARDNGTRLQRNRTHVRQAVFGADIESQNSGAFIFRSHFGAQVFDQSFTAISVDRESETLTRNQRVPAQVSGLLFQWSRSLGTRQALVAGVEAREVRGASDELVYVAGRPSSLVGAGGKERAGGLFVQDVVRLSPKLLVTVGARIDRWRNASAHSTTSPLNTNGPASTTRFPDRTETAFSPRASVLYQATERLSLHASGYRAFRAPTLNELYRAFRVGNVLTLANENLRAERLAGGEAGASLLSLDKRFNARATFFWLEVTRPVANVTLSETSALVTRQRQNLGRTRSVGVEAETEARLNERWSFSAGYQFTQAKVARFPASAALEGLRLPQVPAHTLTFRTDYAAPRAYALSLQGRMASGQFEDDLNRLPLKRFFTLDAFASRTLSDNFELFAAAENLTGTRYEVGRTPVTTLGPPALVRLGLRLRLGPR